LEELERDKDYSRACSKFFSCKHHWYPQLAQNIYHPNQYYVESRKALRMSGLTPPDSGQEGMQTDIKPNDVSLMADTTTDTIEESIFETEDEFDRSIANMSFDVDIKPTIVPNESQEQDQ